MQEKEKRCMQERREMQKEERSRREKEEEEEDEELRGSPPLAIRHQNYNEYKRNILTRADVQPR